MIRIVEPFRVLATVDLPTTERCTEIVVQLTEFAFDELEQYGRAAG